MKTQKKKLALTICILVICAVGFMGGFYLSTYMHGQVTLLLAVAVIFVFLMWFGSGAEILGLLRDWYREACITPQLSIEYKKEADIFYLEADIIDSDRNIIGKRKYQKICIKNSGGVARNCEAELRLIKWDNSAIAPSKESKSLVWWNSSRDNILLKQDISGKIGTKYLYVVFSEEIFANKSKDSNDIYAFVSTEEELFPKDIRTRLNGFGIGNFIIEVTVTSEDGSIAKANFELHVDKDFRKLSMRKISQKK